jgi:hypothetical protein
MKVKIGPYKDYIGPHQLAEKICFWIEIDRYSDEEDPKPVRLLYNFFDNNMWIVKTVNWLTGYYRPRVIKIHIDEYDVWSADTTLSQIIVPILEKLKEVKHGTPYTDDEDVPEHLRSTNAPPVDTSVGMVDDLIHARWNWILDEMIWAHRSIIHEGAEEDSWYDPLPPGTPIIPSKTVENEDGSITWQVGNEHGIFNPKRRDAFLERQSRGLKLFGKYYCSLWD